MNPSQLLTPAKAAWVLDVAPSTLDQWREKRLIAHTLLPAARSNSSRHVVRYRPEDILEFACRYTVRARTGERGGPLMEEADWDRIRRLIDATIASRLEL